MRLLTFSKQKTYSVLSKWLHGKSRTRALLLCWERNLPQVFTLPPVMPVWDATPGIITTPTNNWLRSEEYTVWVFLAFWKSKWCKLVTTFHHHSPHFHTWESHCIKKTQVLLFGPCSLFTCKWRCKSKIFCWKHRKVLQRAPSWFLPRPQEGNGNV